MKDKQIQNTTTMKKSNSRERKFMKDWDKYFYNMIWKGAARSFWARADYKERMYKAIWENNK